MTIFEKLKLVRTSSQMTQEQFAKAIGISRGNLANIELGKVLPTPLFINCVCLMFDVSKEWLTDDNNNDINALNQSTNSVNLILSQYEKLDDKYKEFVATQISQLLELQDKG